MSDPILVRETAGLLGCVPLVGQPWDVAVADVVRERLAADLMRLADGNRLLRLSYIQLIQRCSAPSLWLQVDHDDPADAFAALQEIWRASFDGKKRTKH